MIDLSRPNDPKTRAAAGKLSGIVGVFCNILLFGGKLAVGLLTGSVSVTADAMNNLSDAVSSIVTLVGFKLAEKPADADHPYGHARYEYLSGLAVAALIIVIGVELGKSSIDKILHPAPVAFTLPLVVVLVVAVILKLGLSAFNTMLGKKISSTALLATAADSRNDAISTSAVLIAAGLEMAFGWQLDGWMGLAVAAFVLYSGAMLAKDTISPLLGETATPELRQLIVDVVTSDEKVLGYHDLMVHDYGPGQRFASIHVEMDRREDPLECHERIDELERLCLQQHNIHLVIHYDPVITDDPELNRLQNVVSGLLQQIQPEISIHDFRMLTVEDRVRIFFDVAMPPELMSRKEEISHRLEALLAEAEPQISHTFITFDIAT
ncbi:MAG: cation transporter [Oscillospiraceae bacterium]|nr:cation transporter [Oscillospiraceae bacterium]